MPSKRISPDLREVRDALKEFVSAAKTNNEVEVREKGGKLHEHIRQFANARIADAIADMRLMLEKELENSPHPQEIELAVISRLQQAFREIHVTSGSFRMGPLIDAGILECRLDQLGFQPRVENCFRELGVSTVDELTQITAAQILAVRGAGEGSLMAVRYELRKRGLRLKDDIWNGF
jgi:DNA-directed RNA polymerase alpha subunit